MKIPSIFNQKRIEETRCQVQPITAESLNDIVSPFGNLKGMDDPSLLRLLLLQEGKGLKYFLDHCRKTHSEELLFCFLAIKSYKDSTKTPREDLYEAAESIAKAFLKVGARMEVNVEREVVARVWKKINEKRAQWEPPCDFRNVFDEVSEEVSFLLLSRLSSLRVSSRSRSFFEMIREDQKPEGKHEKKQKLVN